MLTCYAIIILFIIMTIFMLSLGLYKEQKLVNTFERNDIIWDKDEMLKHSEDFLETIDLTLLNLDYLQSYKGEYRSVLFKSVFQIKCYKNFDILTLHTFNFLYNIKLPKSATSLKKDIFAGKLLRIRFKGHNLLFKLPNEKQNTIYKRYRFNS